jgi:hypothetical protein
MAKRGRCPVHWEQKLREVPPIGGRESRFLRCALQAIDAEIEAIQNAKDEEPFSV